MVLNTYGVTQGPIVDKATQAYELIAGLRNGMIVRQAGLAIRGFVIPTSWGDKALYEDTFKARMEELGDTQTFLLRSDKTATFGVVV